MQPAQQAQQARQDLQVHKGLRGFKASLVHKDLQVQPDQLVRQDLQVLYFSPELAPHRIVWATTETCTSPLIYQGCMDLNLLELGPLESL